MKKLLVLILSIGIFQQAVAKEYALQIFDQTAAVMQPKVNGIDLEDAKALAVDDNIDIRIAYERLFQAQRKIGLARAQYFPYGIGDLAFLYFNNAFIPLILVEMGTSLPTKWYNVQKEKHLRNAEAWNLKALRENIKHQTALLYYNIVKEESMVALAGYEIKLLEELLAARSAEISVGVVNADELTSLQTRILYLRSEYLKFEAYLNEEKAAMKMLLNLPYTSELKLNPVAEYLDESAYDLDLEAISLGVVERSYEVKAAKQIVAASYDAKRSTQWSILSFRGIGFGYLSRVRFHKSKVRESKLRLDAIRGNVQNSIYTKASMLESSVNYFLAEKEISDVTERFMRGQLQVFTEGRVSVGELIETEITFLRDFRNTLRAHYNALTRLDDFDRVALTENELE